MENATASLAQMGSVLYCEYRHAQLLWDGRLGKVALSESGRMAGSTLGKEEATSSRPRKRPRPVMIMVSASAR